MSKWTPKSLIEQIKVQARFDLFQNSYGSLNGQLSGLKRVQDLVTKTESPATHLFSAPGRTELGGNHTDHNHGKVICAAVQNDTLAAVSPRSDGQVVVRSQGFSEVFSVNSSDLDARLDEQGNTNSLIRGVMAGVVKAGGQLGGFNADITSNVGVGSGLSSSASFEVLLGTIINDLFNNNEIAAEEIARIGQFAENTFFGKPCGLMDQTASAVGGILQLDFKDPTNIDINRVNFNLEDTNYLLVVVNTGSSHADLTAAYASIPGEMKSVAAHMGAEVLRSQKKTQVLENLNAIRSELGDRAVLRAMHYYSENQRVNQMVAALEANDFEAFLDNVAASGASSQNILQNVIPPRSDGKEQGLALTLGISQLFMEEKGRGVARVHGGGFAGTIQAYVHEQDFTEYNDLMSRFLGPEAIELLKIRPHGACQLLQLK